MSEIFFTAHLMGGLGNQMFQIAHTISQGLVYNVESKFKPVSFTPNQAHQPTKYLTNIYRNVKFENDFFPKNKITNTWGFKNLSINPNISTEFFGYYQGSKHFYGHDEKIKKIFKPSEEFLSKIFFEYPQLKTKNNVSIHIRRGDYLNISNVLPTIDISYIIECLNLISDYDNIFILSDDKKWVEENINYDKIIIPKNLEDFEELWLISLCKYNIMSNSTFSWWGSFLNENENKVVFVPNLWFGPDGESNYQDLYEKSWKKINVNFKNGKLICY